MTQGTIKSYLDELDRELRARRAPRRRLLAEAADHLRSCAAELADEGLAQDDAERTAVERFGRAALVARRFAYAAASSSTRTSLVWVTTALAAYAAAAVVFVVAAPPWLLDFPQGAPSMLALQVAFVALGLSVVRAFAGNQVRLVANGALVTGLAIVVAGAAELLLGLTRPAAAPWDEAVRLIAVYAVAAAVALVAVPAAVRAASRASSVEARERDVPLAALVAAHPVAACAAVAGAACAAVFVAGAVGTDFAHHAPAATGAAAAALVEAAAVVGGFVTLGKVLGLRA